MAGILKRIRTWFGRKLGYVSISSLNDGFLVLDPEQPKELTLTKMTLDVGRKNFLGIIPVFGTKSVGSISFTSLITAPILEARAFAVADLKQIPKKLLKQVSTVLKDSNTKRIERVKSGIDEEADRLVEKFDEKYLRDLIKTDRNGFRQKLLEEIGTETSKVFAEVAKKHIAELVLRVRQETASDFSDEDKTAPVALPTGTRFFIRKGKMTVFVVEQPPQKRTMKIMGANGERSEMYQLSFPYVVFFVVMRGRKSDKLYVFFKKEPVRDTKDALLCPALPNIFEDFSVCFSPSASKGSLAQMAEESINSFWGGRFVKTHDPSNLARQISIEKWKDETRKDALFGLSHGWRDAKNTIAAMLDKISTDFSTDTAHQKKKGPNGETIISALDTFIGKMTSAIANDMKEVCFSLVREWKTDEIVMSQVIGQFKRTSIEFCTFAKAQLGNEIDGLLTEQSLRDIFEAAVVRTITSMNADMAEPVAVARQAVLALIKENSDGTDLHKKT